MIRQTDDGFDPRSHPICRTFEPAVGINAERKIEMDRSKFAAAFLALAMCSLIIPATVGNGGRPVADTVRSAAIIA
jgi:hypothetical protein